MLKSFPPVISKTSRFIVIGSMPGIASLNAQEYYAYKHNAFWPIIFDVFAQGRPPKNYADKLHLLLSHSGALWDTLASCQRRGSLDGNIKRPIPNDFPALFTRFPHLHTLLFNGQAAAVHFKRAFGFPADKTCCVLPSTSPANAQLSYAGKLTVWKEALLRAEDLSCGC